MTKARRYHLASGGSSTLAAATMLMRDALPKGPADFAAGFLVALGAAFLFSAWLVAGQEDEMAE
jgi:hypothetical protein